MMEESTKITAAHLCRKAFLYVRQSTIRQVYENTESKERQYGLQQRAIALGWPQSQIEVIDDDLGQSAAAGSERTGFQRLVADVSLGHAGIVMGLEVSRLARSCSEWHKLIEICALSHTLILDEDGLYDPIHFNDRLLLGLKGAMSEAELHVIRARLRGGMLNKAKRGELIYRLSIGFIKDTTGRVIQDPDQQVQESIRLFFDTFRRQGTAQETVRFFRIHQISFPKRCHTGINKGELEWGPLTTSRALAILHNPCYAGAYAYGRRQVKREDGRIKYMPRENWHSFIPDAHEGYISWEVYEQNQQQLRANDIYPNRQGPPREGPALLQGIVICGCCGNRMTARYHKNATVLNHHYHCRGGGNTQALPECQAIPGIRIDRAVSDLLLEVVSPTTLEIAMAIQDELQHRIDEIDQLHHQQIDRASYEADLARRRYMEVDPANRLVAGTLEEEWNKKLEFLKKEQEEYERRRKEDRLELNEEARQKISSLTADFAQLWNNPQTPIKEKKRLVRLLIEDVTLLKDSEIHIHIRFKGGASRSLAIANLEKGGGEQWKTPDNIIKKVDRLLNDHTYGEIAIIFNERGIVTGTRKAYTGRRIMLIQKYYGLQSRFSRLKQAGFLTVDEIVERLGISKRRMRYLRSKKCSPVGFQKLNDKGEYMFESPSSTIESQRKPFRRKVQRRCNMNPKPKPNQQGSSEACG